MTHDLVIIGTGGSAYDVLDIVEAINAAAPTWRVAGFLDDGRLAGSQHLGYPILGPLGAAARLEGVCFINVIGSDRSYRQRPGIIASTGLPARRFATLVHPAAAVSSRARLGHGVYVNHGVTIAGGVTVGDHVSICPGGIVGHDSVIDDLAILAPGAVVSGFVHVGRASYIGARSVIRQHVNVAQRRSSAWARSCLTTWNRKASSSDVPLARWFNRRRTPPPWNRHNYEACHLG